MAEALPVVLEAHPVSNGAAQEDSDLVVRQPSALPAVQTAAVVAGGIVAGAATVALARRVVSGPARRRGTISKRGRRRKLDRYEVVSSRSFLVDVHLIDRH